MFPRVLAAVASAMIGITGIATAEAQSPHPTKEAINCDGGTIRSASYLKPSDGPIVGTIYLCKTSTDRYWATLALYQPVAPGNWGNAYLDHYIDGQPAGTFPCHEPVTPENQSCSTPKVSGPGPRHTFRARAILCSGIYPICNTRIAYGQTATVH